MSVKSYVCIASAVAVTACSGEDELQGCEETVNHATQAVSQDPVFVNGGVLTFATDSAYEAYSLQMANADEETRINTEHKLGFQSMVTFADSLQLCESELTIEARFPDLFSSDFDGHSDLDIPTQYAVVCNPDGYFRIGDRLFKVTKSLMGYVVDGDCGDVSDAIEGKEMPECAEYRVWSISSAGSNLKAARQGCGQTQIKTSAKNARWWMDYTIRVYVDKAPSNHVLLYIEQKAKHFRKRHKWSSWREHSNQCYSRNIKGKIIHPLYSKGDFAIGDWYAKNNAVNQSNTTKVAELYSQLAYEDVEPYFASIYGSAGSEGLGTTIITILCQ